MSIKFGDILRCKVGGPNRKQGDCFKVIIVEGDGTVGSLRHSLCYKYVNGAIDKEYLYEVPWDDTEIVTDKWRQECIKLRIQPIENEIKQKQEELKRLEAMKELAFIDQDKEDNNIRDFIKSLKD